MANDKILNMKLPGELDNALKQAAKERYMSQASLVRMILAEWIKDNCPARALRDVSVEEIFHSLPGFVTSGDMWHG
jgi:uncharacterized protein YqeY